MKALCPLLSPCQHPPHAAALLLACSSTFIFPSPPKELPHFTASFPPSWYLSTTQRGGVKEMLHSPWRQ